MSTFVFGSLFPYERLPSDGHSVIVLFYTESGDKSQVAANFF